MKVSVVYALADRQIVRDLEIPDGTILAVAVEQSGLLQELSQIEPASMRVGIYGREMPLDTVLQAGDRVEIYRTLSAEPKEARRRRIRRS